jgi:transcriptional regulator with XRE-family HTH domain
VFEDQEFYEEVGRRIRDARKEKKLTQDALASRVSLTRTSITNIEKGRQKFLLHKFFDIANVLQIEPNVLLPDNSEEATTDIDQKLEGRSKDEQVWIKSTISDPKK